MHNPCNHGHRGGHRRRGFGHPVFNAARFAAAFGPDGPFGRDGPFGPDGPYGPGGPFGRGGGRRRRMFNGEELRLVLLKLLADQPRHGYELIKAIEELTGGDYAPSPGIIYPSLTMLDDMGLIAEQKGPDAKKIFEATDEGRAHLAEQADEVEKLLARLDAVGEERRSSPRLQLQRAMENLRNAIRSQRHAGNLEGRVEQIVDIIDEAAKKIERS